MHILAKNKGNWLLNKILYDLMEEVFLRLEVYNNLLFNITKTKNS